MKNHLHFALQSAQWGCGSILDTEFSREFGMSKDETLRCINMARSRLMDALDNLSTYQAELSGELTAASTGEKQ